MNTDSSMYNESSWGETLKNYRIKTQSLPWGDTFPSRPFYVTSFDVKRKEREFDPIMNRYRDDTQEQKLQERERAIQDYKLQQAKERRQRTEKPRNIITNRHVEEGKSLDPTKAENYFNHGLKPKDSSLSWNLLSHYPQEEHVHLSADPDRNEPYKSHPVTIRTRDGKLPVSHQRREFNILTEKYHTNHEERSREDRMRLREQLTEKYWKTHVYDPLKGRYFNPKREQEQKETEQRIMARWGQDQFQKLPIGYQESEGQCFNIMNNDIKKPKTLQKYLDREEKRLRGRRGKAQTEHRLREEGVTELARSEQQSLQRVSYDRWQSIEDRKYNIVDGTNRALLGQPRVSQKPDSWETIKQLSSSSKPERQHINHQSLRQMQPQPQTQTQPQQQPQSSSSSFVPSSQQQPQQHVPMLDLSKTIRTKGLEG